MRLSFVSFSLHIQFAFLWVDGQLTRIIRSWFQDLSVLGPSHHRRWIGIVRDFDVKWSTRFHRHRSRESRSIDAGWFIA